jgi:hypothetical protein
MPKTQPANFITLPEPVAMMNELSPRSSMRSCSWEEILKILVENALNGADPDQTA